MMSIILVKLNLLNLVCTLYSHNVPHLGGFLSINGMKSIATNVQMLWFYNQFGLSDCVFYVESRNVFLKEIDK